MSHVIGQLTKEAAIYDYFLIIKIYITKSISIVIPQVLVFQKSYEWKWMVNKPTKVKFNISC